MKIESVLDPAFAAYGQVVTGLEEARAEILAALAGTPQPAAGTDYCPEDPVLQELPAAAEVSGHLFGGMPCQLGWCNGRNTKLNCLEYHRDSEYNLANEDFILLLARRDEIENGRLDTGKVRAFRVPAGTLVEVYATTLHYAPGQGLPGAGGAARRHQHRKAGHRPQSRRGCLAVGLQQVAAGPPGFRRGRPGRRGGAGRRKH